MNEIVKITFYKIFRRNMMFNIVERSLEDILGYDYTNRVKEYMVRMFGEEEDKIASLLQKKVNFFPNEFEEDLDNRLDQIGKQIIPPFETDVMGASTDSFKSASHFTMSPVGGKGFYRVGEDGRVYFTSKSEHYHTSLGHNFPGYKLVQNAKAV